MKINLDNINSTLIHHKVGIEIYIASKNIFGSLDNANKFSNTTQINIEKSRRTIANIIECKPENIFFASGEIETYNKIINNFVTKYNIKSFITNYIENSLILDNIKSLKLEDKIELIYLNSKSDFEFDLHKLEQILVNNTNSLLSLTHTDYTTGHLIPIKKISELCRKYNSYLHIDFSLSINYYKLNFKNLNLDIATFNSNKFHGPSGISFIYINSIILDINKNNQNFHLEFTTESENILGIIGMSKAIELMQEDIEKNIDKIRKIKNIFLKNLDNNKIEYILNCNPHKNLCSLLNLKFPKIDNNKLFINKLEINNIIAYNNLCANNNTIRFSFSIFNTLKQINSINYNIFKY